MREMRPHAAQESSAQASKPEPAPSQAEVFRRTTCEDRSLSSATQADLVNNLNDGVAWGLFPLIFGAAGL